MTEWPFACVRTLSGFVDLASGSASGDSLRETAGGAGNGARGCSNGHRVGGGGKKGGKAAASATASALASASASASAVRTKKTNLSTTGSAGVVQTKAKAVSGHATATAENVAGREAAPLTLPPGTSMDAVTTACVGKKRLMYILPTRDPCLRDAVVIPQYGEYYRRLSAMPGDTFAFLANVYASSYEIRAPAHWSLLPLGTSAAVAVVALVARQKGVPCMGIAPAHNKRGRFSVTGLPETDARAYVGQAYPPHHVRSVLAPEKEEQAAAVAAVGPCTIAVNAKGAQRGGKGAPCAADDSHEDEDVNAAGDVDGDVASLAREPAITGTMPVPCSEPRRTSRPRRKAETQQQASDDMDDDASDKDSNCGDGDDDKHDDDYA